MDTGIISTAISIFSHALKGNESPEVAYSKNNEDFESLYNKLNILKENTFEK